MESASLNLWIEYLRALFDAEASAADKRRVDEKIRLPPLSKEQADVLKAIHKKVDDYLQRCEYHFVSAKSVFRYVGAMKGGGR